jgi:hypothetical protein
LILLALPLHFESQCIPTPFSWYLYQLPIWFHKLSVVATYVIEIMLPFLFFMPSRQLRLISCYGQVRLGNHAQKINIVLKIFSVVTDIASSHYYRQWKLQFL